MLSNIAIGAMLILLTTAVHAGGMSLALRSVRSRSSPSGPGLRLNCVLGVGRVVLIMYLVAIVEILIWSAAYLAFDVIEGFEKAIYFSAVTFTTLGYGDVVLDGSRPVADAFKQQLVDSLKKTYPIVMAPGPDVARIRFAITDLRQNRPVHSDFSADGPIDLGKDNVKRRAATSWSGSGATEAEVLIIDSLTQDVIAAAKDSRTTGLKEKFTKWGAAEDAFQFWATSLKRLLDQAHGLTMK